MRRRRKLEEALLCEESVVYTLCWKGDETASMINKDIKHTPANVDFFVVTVNFTPFKYELWEEINLISKGIPYRLWANICCLPLGPKGHCKSPSKSAMTSILSWRAARTVS